MTSTRTWTGSYQDGAGQRLLIEQSNGEIVFALYPNNEMVSPPVIAVYRARLLFHPTQWEEGREFYVLKPILNGRIIDKVLRKATFRPHGLLPDTWIFDYTDYELKWELENPPDHSSHMLRGTRFQCYCKNSLARVEMVVIEKNSNNLPLRLVKKTVFYIISKFPTFLERVIKSFRPLNNEISDAKELFKEYQLEKDDYYDIMLKISLNRAEALERRLKNSRITDTRRKQEENVKEIVFLKVKEPMSNSEERVARLKIAEKKKNALLKLIQKNKIITKMLCEEIVRESVEKVFDLSSHVENYIRESFGLECNEEDGLYQSSHVESYIRESFGLKCNEKDGLDHLIDMCSGEFTE